ncbi:MAG: hypothetical protein CL942_11065 [Desulfovibrio sp.]|nr:hypothetical protein [Desulfovibrio sp.]|tara:strand:- start:5036 stop:5452 length:417 start_codon:yes stop_codon:yes gene_type:complete
MKKLVWSSQLNLGVKPIDEQHKWLVHLTNNLRSAIASGVHNDLLLEVCQELVDYTDYHFRDEELLMEEYEYDGLDSQRKSHQYIRDQIHDFLKRLESGETVAAENLLETLRKWLVNHVAHSDMKLAQHIRSQDQEPTS